ncbi:unnamed protein product [Caenorhabditis sp. 36 PRJEB53466]|nr:unnamed protein product [Caenorhabditis sp. 36 PRJEB53466]
MVKKISFYTAYGQFLEMVERQAEQELELSKQEDTDRYPIDHPLSDYQDALISDIQVQSCPADLSVPAGPVCVRKTVSCPHALLASALSTTAPAFAIVDPIQSPVPTSVESRKLNDATALMMSFWKVHVTMRKKKPEQLPSLFEKLEGIFSSPSTSEATRTDIPTIFGKIEGLFEEESEKDTTSGSTIPFSDMSSELTVCSLCEMWKSMENPAIPQLPVFVRSPIDSLRLYQDRKCFQNTDEMADDELTLIPSPVTISRRPSTSSSSSSSSSSGVSHRTNSSECVSFYEKRHRLMEKMVKKQQEIIKSLLELNNVSNKLSKFGQ